MPEIVKSFENCLNSNLSLDIINETMNKLSKYKLNKEIDEKNINFAFMIYCSNHFSSEMLSIDKKYNNNVQYSLCNEKLFEISHLIIKNKEKYNNNSYYESIELFYQTFFFYEFSEENKTENFTFYKKISENLIKQEDYDTYLYNIGNAILKNKINEKELLEILFSEETPKFLRNIILICVEYIRATTKNVLDFIKLCIPFLNHYNFYYLNQKLEQYFHFQFRYLSEINYHNLEKFISCSNKKNIIDEEKPKENIISIAIKKNKEEIFNNIEQEEISKYFNFPNDINYDEKNNLLKLLSKENLESNEKKFLDLINGDKFTIIYDNPNIDSKYINAFSFIFLLKYKLINQINEHFFQIYNFGNTKIELFSFLLKKYLEMINNLLDNTLSNEQKQELYKNSGFYKLHNDYILLINVEEDNEKIFYLKQNLGVSSMTSKNKNKEFKAFQISVSDCSSLKDNSEYNKVKYDDIEEEELCNFGNYSFENELRTFFKNYISDNKEIYELPRLFFLLNYCIPNSKDRYYFITNVKSKKYNNKPYGFSELDFVLNNESSEDISINPEFLPYKEKLFMHFPKNENNNSKTLILKHNSIIFFELKKAFPEYYWKDKIKNIFKKIKKFIEIYQKRGIYNNQNIQIFFIYDYFPISYEINDLKNYIIKEFSKSFPNFEFGIYYFSLGLNLVNSTSMQKKFNENIQKLENNVTAMKTQMDNTQKFINEFSNLLKNLGNDEIKKKIESLENNYNMEK